LAGSILLKQEKAQESIAHFRKAVEQEEHMVYNEPRDWLLNPKQYLGAAYLQAGQYAEAGETFKKDMKVNAENVWSLHGLHQALQKQHKRREAMQVKKQFEKAAEQSDVSFSSI